MISSPLLARIKTGVILACCFAGVLFLGPRALEVLCVLMTGTIIFEFLSVALPPFRRPSIGIGLMRNDAFLYAVTFSTIPLALLLGGLQSAVAIASISAVLVLVREFKRFEFGEHEEPQKEVLGAIGIAAIYPLLLGTTLLGSLCVLSQHTPGFTWKVVAWFVSIVILNDTGAYFCGQAIGKKKLAPRVSPNKTVEGALGGLLLALILSIPLAWLFRLPIAEGVLFNAALLISVLSQLGDLAESFVKRLYNVKDMGQLLPGHGGVFDRVDGYLFAAPALYLLSLAI